ncbi:MAG TPA: 6-phosphogluconolactonase [Marmoricola sp.]|nr:6-phosphogluconolactonase [Marmoricola sp.]
MNDPRALVHDSADELARDVASRLLTTLTSLQAEGRLPHIALTGGSIADKIHAEVARQTPGSPVRWDQVEIWWGDERFVPRDDPQRNALQARRAMLDRLPVSQSRVHEIPSSDDADSPYAAAVMYSDMIRNVGSGEFDVVMLGLGQNGHVASLMPHFPQLHVTDQIAVGVTDSPKPPPDRVSLTFEALNRAREVWFVVAGEDKADAVRRALAAEGSVDETPARGVHGRLRTHWFLDLDAAARL